MNRLLTAILISLLLCVPLSAALPNYTSTWAVFHAGNDTNGGGFDSAGTGTDMSQFPNKNAAGCTSCQSAVANISTTDAVCAGTTTVTSATGAFTLAINGNFIRLNGGTGSLTAVWKEATFVSATSITIDAACAAGTGITMNIGGALGTWAQVTGTNMQLSFAPQVWVKADALYSITATITIDSGGSNDGIATISCYTATRGDGGSCTVQGAAGIGGADNFLMRFNGSPRGTVLSNVILDCNSLTFTGGLRYDAAFETAHNITASNCSDGGFYVANVGMVCDNCRTTNTPAAGISGANNWAFGNAAATGFCINCQALGSTNNGAVAFNQWCGGILIGAVAANFTGTTADAFTCTTQEGDELIVLNMSIYNITRDAFRFGESNAIDSRPLVIRNAVISKVGGYCFDNVGSIVYLAVMFVNDHNACDTTTGPPTGFYHAWPAGTGDVTLTGIPFTAGGSNNFALNGTAGAGASAKAAGFPGVIASGTGSLDMGALQSAGSASSVTIGTPTVQ